MNHRSASALTTAMILLVSTFATLPYAQQTANSHMDAGPLLAIVYATLAVVAAAIVVLDLRQRWAFVLPIATTLGYAWWLADLVCEKCATSG